MAPRPGGVAEVSSRPYRGDEDFWRIRDLLVETHSMTPPGFNWEIRRWDGLRFHNENPEPDPSWNSSFCVWETEEGRLVGAVHPEGRDYAHRQVHPEYRHLQDEMVEWAQANLGEDTERGLRFFAFDYDVSLLGVLAARGFTKTDSSEVTRRMRLGATAPHPVSVAPGYAIRTTRPGDNSDHAAIAALLNAAFRRDRHTAAELATFTSTSPSFSHDLDLVAVATEGTPAAYVGVTYEAVNRYGVFEPVCTHPVHRRKGLAAALMTEGLRRLVAVGATDVYVATGDDPGANALYASVGFAEAYRGWYWEAPVGPGLTLG